MFDRIYNFLDYFLGLSLDNKSMTLFYLIHRISLIYILGILFVRFNRQFMGMRTPFYYMINLVLGSILANAIIGTVSYLAALGMALFILLVNFGIATISFYSKSFEYLVKGRPVLLISDGQIRWDAMRRNLMTYDELMDSVRRNTKSDDISKIEKAYFETSSRITIILKNKH